MKENPPVDAPPVDAPSEVLIAGAGPTGLAAALFLAERGIRARVVDRTSAPAPGSRALAVNARTLRLLEGTGVTEELLARGRVRAASLWRPGRRVARIDLSRVRDRYAFMLIHPQSGTEALLAEAVEACGVSMERGVALEAVEVLRSRPGDGVGEEATGEGTGTGGAGVTLSRWGRASGDGDGSRVGAGDGSPTGRGTPGVEREEVEVDVLLGADGARSTVRREAGIGFPGSAYEEPWWLYDLALETPLPPDEVHIFLLDDGAMLVARVDGEVWRVAGTAPGRLERLPAGTVPGAVSWESEFRVAHRVAERFRKGPLFLAGDAAHIHSPTGGRGMNLGIEDAWVFAALAAEGRLSDYERLRRPVVRKVVREVERRSEISRRGSLSGRVARVLAPVFGAVAGFAAPAIGRWLLGLDHDVETG